MRLDRFLTIHLALGEHNATSSAERSRIARIRSGCPTTTEGRTTAQISAHKQAAMAVGISDRTLRQWLVALLFSPPKGHFFQELVPGHGGILRTTPHSLTHLDCSEAQTTICKQFS
jgi:hypothetical protein